MSAPMNAKEWWESRPLAEICARYNVTDDEFPFVIGDAYAAYYCAERLAEALSDVDGVLACGAITTARQMITDALAAAKEGMQ